MKCPRCDSEIRYGILACPYCGLRFKYKPDFAAKQSAASRSTACMLAHLFGVLGVHNFYLGYFLRGIVRVVLFAVFCGSFAVPQIIALVESGAFKITFDYYGILGLVSIVAVLASWALAGVELLNLALGKTKNDAFGYPLKN